MPDSLMFNIVLVEPEIPPNTGSIARLCGATGTILHLIKPLGFKTDDRYLKRAGLDYWQYVTIKYWDNLSAFLAATDRNRLVLLSKKVAPTYTSNSYQPGDFLVFGKETKGLPEEMLIEYADRCFSIPMRNADKIRSLNLAMAAGIVLYEAIRQQNLTEPQPIAPGLGPNPPTPA